MARMKLKQLEQHLQEVDEFEEPKILLEQYPTRPHIAACMIHTMASTFNDVEDRVILDLGCGSGVLAIGCVMLGAGAVIGVDIDPDALDICQQNLEAFDIDNVDLVNTSVREVDSVIRDKVEVVVMNPPFGTKHNKGLDLEFLEKGIKLASRSVYSLHKTSTRDHVLKKGESWGTKPQVVAELRYDLPATYKHHKKSSVDIHVDFIRFQIS
jgi:predicted RNA methylase